MSYDHVETWMSTELISVEETNTLSTAFQLMKTNQVRRLPVLSDDEQLIGIITWGDVREGRPKEPQSMTLQQIWESHSFISLRNVHDFMTENPIVIGPKASIREAVELMLTHKIGGLPVVEDDHVIGMITESDIFRFLLDSLPEESTTQVPQEIESE